jgi:hypothetical protein
MKSGKPPSSKFSIKKVTKKNHKLWRYSTPRCICTPPQCYHWWPSSPTDQEMWNGGTVCVPREYQNQWHHILSAFHSPTT